MKKKCEIRMATKELVDSLLAMNTNNRGLRERVVNKYSEDIKNGNWKLTNQGIGVTSDGVLADGQHRLKALKACGYPPVEILIVYGLDPDVQIAIDAHTKRNARDLMQFAFGHRVSRSAPAIGNVLLKVDTAKWGWGFSNHQLMDCLVSYADQIEFVCGVPKNANYFAAPMLAAFAFVLKKLPDNADAIKRFMESVESGELLTKTMPEYHLRNFIGSSSKQKGGSELQKERFEKAVKSLTASLNNETMGVLRAGN